MPEGTRGRGRGSPKKRFFFNGNILQYDSSQDIQELMKLIHQIIKLHKRKQELSFHTNKKECF